MRKLPKIKFSNSRMKTVWIAVFLLNLPVLLLMEFILFFSSAEGIFGLLLAIVVVLMLGVRYCNRYPLEMAQTIAGLIFTGFTQLLPVLQVGSLFVGGICGEMFYGIRVTESIQDEFRSTVSLHPNGEYGGFLITFVSLITLTLIGRFIGYVIHTITPERYWHNRSGIWNTFWFLTREDVEQLSIDNSKL